MRLIGFFPIFRYKYYMMIFKDQVQEYEEELLTRQVILPLLSKYKRPNDKINELVKKGELTTLKKGLYIPGPKMNIRKPEPFLVANHLWGPSYISLETALSYWGLIPERVYEISSVTMKAARTYKTEMGRFSYLHADLPYYSFGIRSVPLTPRQVVLIASPEKALCDKVIMTAGILLRSSKQAQEFLIDDLRLDEDKLHELNLSEMRTWLSNAPKTTSLEILIKTLAAL